AADGVDSDDGGQPGGPRVETDNHRALLGLDGRLHAVTEPLGPPCGASHTNSPPTKVWVTRPCRRRPRNGLFRPLLARRAGSTSQYTCASTRTQSPGEPGVRLPVSNPRTPAGPRLNRAASVSSEILPVCTSSVSKTATAVSSP